MKKKLFINGDWVEANNYTSLTSPSNMRRGHYGENGRFNEFLPLVELLPSHIP
jgi:hypothetical protein